MLHRKMLRVLAACLCLTLLSMLCACVSVQQPQDISCYAAEPQPEEAPDEATPKQNTPAEESPAAPPVTPAQPDTAQPEREPLKTDTVYCGPADGESGEGAATADAAPVEICSLQPDSRPVTSLTHEQALADAVFGSAFPPVVPEGFTAEAISRYEDSLTGLWCSGYCELYWTVRAFEDADASRVTAASDTENYDLSLYPIPRADSVPESLREIVDDPIFDAAELTQSVVDARTDTGDEGYDCLNFSVKYGALLVTVRAKGVDPAWVYTQLSALAQS